MKKATNKFTQAGTILLAMGLAAGAAVVVPELGAGSQIETAQAADLTDDEKQGLVDRIDKALVDGQKVADQANELVSKVYRYFPDQAHQKGPVFYADAEYIYLYITNMVTDSSGKSHPKIVDNMRTNADSYRQMIEGGMAHTYSAADNLVRGIEEIIDPNHLASTVDNALPGWIKILEFVEPNVQTYYDSKPTAQSTAEGVALKQALADGADLIAKPESKGYFHYVAVINALLDKLGDFQNAKETTTITINYQDPDGSPIGTPTTVEVDPGATSVTIPATNLAEIGNYELSKDYTLGTGGTLVLPLEAGKTSVTLKYTLKQASITVKSVDENGKEIGTETQSGVIGTMTDIEAPEINGYTVNGKDKETVTYGTDSEITFTYKKNASVVIPDPDPTDPGTTDPTDPTNPTDPDPTDPTDPDPTDPDTTNPTTPTDPERPTLPITGGETGGDQEKPTTDPVTDPTTAVKPVLPATGVTTKTTLPQTGERHHVLATWLSTAGVALAGVVAVAVIVARKRRD